MSVYFTKVPAFVSSNYLCRFTFTVIEYGTTRSNLLPRTTCCGYFNVFQSPAGMGSSNILLRFMLNKHNKLKILFFA